MRALCSFVLAASLAACTTESGPPDSGPRLCASTGDCIHADFYAACYQSGAIVPVQLDGGTLPPAPISAFRPGLDGGQLVAANPVSLLFVDGGELWLLDGLNAQIDVLDIGVWPPIALASIATGMGPNQILACDGMVLSINSTDNTVQGIDPATMRTLDGGEVNVGTGTSPELGACDGQHTLYVSEFGSHDGTVPGGVTAIDLSNFSVLASLAVPAQYIAPDPDGGVVIAASEGVAFYPNDAGGTVLLTIASLSPSSSYAPMGPGTVLATDSILKRVRADINPGSACQNPAFLMAAADGTELLESCGGSYANPQPSEVARIRPGDFSSAGAIGLSFTNPGRMALLKGGLVAIADSATPSVAVFDPASGKTLGVFTPCPVLDAGPGEFISDVVAVP